MTIHSFGLALGLPELGLFDVPQEHFHAASSIYLDLKHRALSRPDLYLQQMASSATVLAVKMGCTYTIRRVRLEDVVEGREEFQGECEWALLAALHTLVPGVFATMPNAYRITLQHDERTPVASRVSCAFCEALLPDRHKVCACKLSAYCNVDCQKADWRTHKVFCFGQTMPLGDADRESCPWTATAAGRR